MVKIKNKGNPIYIGKTLCPRNEITAVNENNLKSYLKTAGGASKYGKTLFVFDDDLRKQQQAERSAVKSKAYAEVRQELSPLIKKEVEDKLEAVYEKKIADLNDKIVSLNAELDTLKNGTSDPAPSKKESPANTTETVESADNDFVFDPEKHVLEHRGRGQYYVMDCEEKVYGPVTADERKKFEALIGE